MLTILGVLGVVAVLFGAAALATREGPILADAPADLADVDLPTSPLRPADIEAVRFSVVVRGYRMSEVDEVLDRLRTELADRDRRLGELAAPDDQPVVPIEPPLDQPPPRPVGQPEPARSD